MTMLSTRGFRIASRKERGLEEGRLRWSVMIMSTSSLERCAKKMMKTMKTTNTMKTMKNHLERCARKPVTISRGRRTRTVIQLNKSVMMAAVKPSLYSLLCLMW